MSNAVKTPNDAATMVDLARYPILNIHSGSGLLFAQQCRQQYIENGLCVLPDFINTSSSKIMIDETNLITSDAYYCKNTHNAYLTEADSSLANEDVTKRQEKTFVGSIPYDRIDENSHLRQLYRWDPLKDFIRFVLNKPTLYRFADPLGACSINVFVNDGEHGWHFDESEFTVTLMLQPPEFGGAFEYVPQIRGLKNEKELVAGILDGERDHVVELPFTEGTLLIFGGRQTIHRVTPVSGGRPRLVPVLCYSERPNQINSDSVRKLFWGRTGNETLETMRINS